MVREPPPSPGFRAALRAVVGAIEATPAPQLGQQTTTVAVQRLLLLQQKQQQRKKLIMLAEAFKWD